jgi:hypothetical protein
MDSRNFYNDANKQNRQKNIIDCIYGYNKTISKMKLNNEKCDGSEALVNDLVNRFAEISPELSRKQANEVLKNMLDEKEKEDYEKNYSLYKSKKEEIVDNMLKFKKSLLSGKHSGKGLEYIENQIKKMGKTFANIPLKQTIKQAAQEIKIMMDEKEENNNCIMNLIYN